MPSPWTMAVTQAAGGTISPGTGAYVTGSNATYTFTPASGYLVSSITIDGVALPVSVLSGAAVAYTFTNITVGHTITATYGGDPGSGYSLTNAIADMRLWTLDTDSSDPGNTDAQLVQWLNDRYKTWWALYEERPEWFSPLSSNSLTAKFPIALVAGTPPSYERQITIPASVAKIHGVAPATAYNYLGGQDQLAQVGPMCKLKDYGAMVARIQNEPVWPTQWPDTAFVSIVSRSDATTVVRLGMAPWPSDGGYAIAALLLTYYPAALALSAMADGMLLNPSSARQVVRLASADAAMALGRDAAFVGQIIQSVPAYVAADTGLDQKLNDYRKGKLQ